MGNNWDDPALSRRRTVGSAIVAFIGDGGSGFDVRTDIERGLELRAVACLPAGQVEGDGQAAEVGLEVDFA